MINSLDTEKLRCPFCDCYIANSAGTHFVGLSCLNDYDSDSFIKINKKEVHYIPPFIINHLNKVIDAGNTSDVVIEYIFCPNCNNMTIKVYNPFFERFVYLYPKSSARKFPDYVPSEIVKDYEEACLISDLSPRASSAMLRRCIQSIIRNRGNIKKERLIDEINEICEQLNLSELLKNALHALRNLGNIGAHPDKNALDIDISYDEVCSMISLVEIIIDEWYIKEHESEANMEKVIKLSQNKIQQKKNK